MRHPNKHRKVAKPAAEELGHILPRSEEQKAADAKRAAKKAARQAKAAARAKARKAKAQNQTQKKPVELPDSLKNATVDLPGFKEHNAKVQIRTKRQARRETLKEAS